MDKEENDAYGKIKGKSRMSLFDINNKTTNKKMIREAAKKSSFF